MNSWVFVLTKVTEKALMFQFRESIFITQGPLALWPPVVVKYSGLGSIVVP